MSDEVPEAAREALGRHEAFSGSDEPGTFGIDTVAFDARVTVRELDGHADRWEVAVVIPSLDAATADHVGPAVQSGWFETMERRLADATQATRSQLDLAECRLANADESGDELLATFAFTWGDPDRAVRIAKALVEYVEGTYVESVVPGYEYEGVVAELLGEAARTGGSEGGPGGPTPL